MIRVSKDGNIVDLSWILDWRQVLYILCELCCVMVDRVTSEQWVVWWSCFEVRTNTDSSRRNFQQDFHNIPYTESYRVCCGFFAVMSMSIFWSLCDCESASPQVLDMIRTNFLPFSHLLHILYLKSGCLQCQLEMCSHTTNANKSMLILLGSQHWCCPLTAALWHQQHMDWKAAAIDVTDGWTEGHFTIT